MEKILKPEKVYATDEVYQSKNCVERMERMMASIASKPPKKVTEAELNEIMLERGWNAIKPWGAIANPRDPDIVFTTAKFHTAQERKERAEKYPNLRVKDQLGYNTHHFRRDGTQEFKEQNKGVVCQSAWELHSINGCPFRCAYCSGGGMNRIFLNLEEYLEHLEEWLNLDPQQRLYKWDNATDVNFFEPEWGWTEGLVRYFGERERGQARNDKYLLIYTGKSANVDFLLDLPHNGHTIIQWSTSARTQSTLIEKETAPMEARIEAAAKCQKAGYIVRHRFSPIIPVKNWREENSEMIELIFQTHNPDVISLCAFGWMSLESAKRCLDFELLDEEFVAAMEGCEPFITERGFGSGGGRPIPHDARFVMFDFLIDEIRKHSSKCIISLCLETAEMWTALSKEIGQSPSSYVCNCGPQSTPGAPLYEKLTGIEMEKYC